MNGRRTMGAMLTEVADGAMAAAAMTGLRATRIELDLPVEIAWTGGALFAELPRNRTRTPFDIPASRLHLVWETRP